MTARLRRFAAALLALAAIALPARAGSLTVDFTDLWWNDPDGSENGWGVNVVQQSDTLFLTFFVYGTDGAARWVVASGMVPTAQQPAVGARFEGDVFQTQGPWFGGPFDPAKVKVDKVGSATITFDSASTATLSYSVSGTAVVKRIKRQGFRVNSVAGVYAGGILATASQCTAAADNGPINFWGTTTVTQTASQMALKLDFYIPTGQLMTCTFTGTPELQGRLAAVSGGTFACVIGNTTYNTGTFSLSALDSQMNGFHATFTGKDQYCTYNGRFGGTRFPGT
jgi:hypothetical protein